MNVFRLSIPVLLVAATLSRPLMADVNASLEVPMVTLEDVKLSAAFNEGTETTLNQKQIGEILPWAVNSMTLLKQALDDIDGQPYVDRQRILLHAIQNVVLASAPKNSELLMRYVLNRGLRIHWVLDTNTNAQDKNLIDTKVRVLKTSIELALKYWELDLAHLKSNEGTFKGYDFATFGLEYSQFLYNLNRSVLDATAQYVIMKTILGLYQWDLYRDSNKTAYAVDIKKISDVLTLYPAGLKGQDQDFLRHVRRLKKIYLSIGPVSKIAEKLRAEQKVKAIAADKARVEAMACKNAPEETYKKTYIEIKEFAFEKDGLNMDTAESNAFADGWLSSHACNIVDEYIEVAKRLKEFAWDEDGLDYNTDDSRNFVLTNLSKFCKNYDIEAEYKKNFDFAFDREGMDYNTVDSRKYAFNKITGPAFACNNPF